MSTTAVKLLTKSILDIEGGFNPNSVSFMLNNEHNMRESFNLAHYLNDKPNNENNPIPNFQHDSNQNPRESMNFQIPSFNPGFVMSGSDVQNNNTKPSFNFSSNDSIIILGFRESIMIKDNITDVQCDDHREMFSHDVQADRYCSKCRKCICNDCVIEYHSEHQSEARNRIDTYLSKQKSEVEELKSKVVDCIQIVQSNDMNSQTENKVNLITGLFKKRISRLELIKSKIDDLINEEKNLCVLASKSLSSGLNNDILNKINQKNFELEDCKNLSLKFSTK